MAEKWITDFKRGCINTGNAERSKEMVISENIKMTNKIILGNRKIKLQEIADTVRISKETWGLHFA